MQWTSYLPNSPESLSRLEWWLWAFAGFFTFVVVLLGFAARSVSYQRAALVQQELQRRATESQAAADSAQKESARLREQLQPRKLSDDKAAQFLQLLRGIPGVPINIASPHGDNEAKELADQFAALLRTSGCSAGRIDYGSGFGAPQGLFLELPAAETAPPYAAALQKALESIGMHVHRTVNQGLLHPGSSITLIVGHKPSYSE